MRLEGGRGRGFKRWVSGFGFPKLEPDIIQVIVSRRSLLSLCAYSIFLWT
jgi:hypothetical protein